LLIEKLAEIYVIPTPNAMAWCRKDVVLIER
jgi:hypothetical protein